MLNRFIPRSILNKQSIIAHSLQTPTPYAYKVPLTRKISSQIPSSLIPRGWTADSTYLAKASDFFPTALYGIKESVTAIVADPGACPTVLIQSSGGEFYIWNEISDDVWLINEPTKLEEITPKLLDPGLEGMKIVELEPVERVAGIAPPI